MSNYGDDNSEQCNDQYIEINVFVKKYFYFIK